MPIVSNENVVLLPLRNPSVVRTTTSPVAAVALWFVSADGHDGFVRRL